MGRQSAERQRVRGRWPIVLLIVVSAAVYWAGNGRSALWDRDEPRFAEPAKEMLLAETVRDLIVPHFNGEPFFHKPPWCYWQILLAYKAFGVNEFAVRFFSGLWAAVAVGLVFYFGVQRSGRAAIVSAAVTATSLLFVVMAKLSTADSTLLVVTLLAVFSLWRIYEGRAAVRHWVLLAGSVGVAGLVKGPAVLLVVVPLVVALVVVDLIEAYRRKMMGATVRTWLLRIGGLVGALLVAGMIAVPWYVVANRLSGGALSGRFVGYDIFRRLVDPIEGHWGPPGFYVLSGLANLWPWSALLVPVCVFAWRRRSDRLVRFLLCWLIAPTLALECIATKMVHYWLGVLPAYCLLVGLAVDHWTTSDDRLWRRWSSAVRIVIATVSVVLAGGIVLGGWTLFGELVSGSIIVAAVLVVFSFVVLLDGRSATSVVTIGALGMAAVTVGASLLVLPSVEQFTLGRRVARRMQSTADGPTRYGLIRWREPSVIFYLHNGKDKVLTGSIDDLPRWATMGRMVVAVRSDEYERLTQRGPISRIGFEEVNRLRGAHYTRGTRRELVILRSISTTTQRAVTLP